MNLAEIHSRFTHEYPALFALVFRTVRYRIPQREDAEDVVAEVFATAYRNIAQYNPAQGNLAQWTCGIARHAVQMYWRSHRPTLPLDDVIESLADLSPVPDVEHRIAVERILRSLPQSTKALLAMRYEDDMTYTEIADVVGKDAAAIRKWFSRLHEKLRLTHEDPDVC